MLGLLVLGRYSLEHTLELERAAQQAPHRIPVLMFDLSRFKAWRSPISGSAARPAGR